MTGPGSQKLVAELQAKVRDLTTLLDKQMGTPCEEIRHAQEIEALKAAHQAELEKLREACAKAAYQWWDDDDAQELREHIRALDINAAIGGE